MARLVLFFLLLAAIAVALNAVMQAMRTAGVLVSDGTRKVAEMPEGIRLVAYILLMVLMLGVTSGLLGAA